MRSISMRRFWTVAVPFTRRMLGLGRAAHIEEPLVFWIGCFLRVTGWFQNVYHLFSVTLCILSPVLFEPAVKPLHHAFNHIALMFRIGKAVSLMLIHYQFGGNIKRFQRMPELVRLWRGAFTVTIAHHHQSRRLCLFNERDGRTVRIDLRIVID